MKKSIAFGLLIMVSCLYAESVSDNSRIKFIKGNIGDKTAAVRESSGKEAAELADAAMDFAIANKAVLGDDRDLDGLAVAAVLAFPSDSIAAYDEGTKNALVVKFTQLFTLFPGDTVRIAVLNKVAMLHETLSAGSFASMLNDFLQNTDGSTPDNGVVKTVISTLGTIGGSESFSVIYTCMSQKKWPQYQNDMNNALALLADKSLPQIIGIIQDGDIKTIRSLFDLLMQNKQTSASFKAEIAENVLTETIYIADNASSVTKDTVSLQLNAMRMISQLKWTRSAAVIISFFDLAKREYAAGVMTDAEFAEVVNGTANVAPMDGSPLLTAYLTELNKQAENGTKVSDTVVLAVVNALGAIGDKTSFDSLLYVTYVNYPENVIAAARDALARLKW